LEAKKTAAFRSGGVKNGPGRLAKDAGNIPVWVGIRPEGFYMDDNGPLTCTLKGVEVMGRDVTVVSTHPAFQGETIRTIIDAKSGVDPSKGEVRYRLRQGKVFVFDQSSGERLYGA
jgi:multiple sugar transport system ATP-binding protein